MTNPTTAVHKTGASSQPSPRSAADQAEALTRRHLRFGWWCLLIFLMLGLGLEALHGFKVGAYLNVSNETRRLMWTLAHAHGTLLGLVNIAFAFTVRRLAAWPARTRTLASGSLRSATVLMPAGFFLGGTFVYSGDPGLGILLVPLGGALLFMAVLLTAMAVSRDATDAKQNSRPKRASELTTDD
jgi:hypothetical protein